MSIQCHEKVNGIEETGLLYGMDQFLKTATLRNRFWKVADSSTTTTTVMPAAAWVHRYTMSKQSDPAAPWVHRYTMSKRSGLAAPWVHRYTMSKQSGPAAPWVHRYTMSKRLRRTPPAGASPGEGEEGPARVYMWVITLHRLGRHRLSDQTGLG